MNLKDMFSSSSLSPTIQNQQDAYNKINALLQQSSSSLLCGPICQKQQLTEKLEQDYLDAQVNSQTAPIHLEETKKKYYTFSKGEAYYNELQEKDLQVKASSIANILSEKFNDQCKQTETLNYYYNTNVINSGNTQELFNQYKKKNQHLEKKIRLSNNDILTNDRKTFYETQEMDNLTFYYNILFTIYYVIVTVFSILFLFKQGFGILLKLFLIFIMVVLPYLIIFLGKRLYHMYSWIVSYLPKNVYNNI